MKKLILPLCLILSGTLAFGQIGLLERNRRGGNSSVKGGREVAVTRDEEAQEPATKVRAIPVTNPEIIPTTTTQEEGAVGIPRPSNSKYSTVISIPVGEQGVHYKGGEVSESEITGPSSLRIAQDGSFLVADTAGD